MHSLSPNYPFSFSKKTPTLLRYNLYPIKFTHLKCIIKLSPQYLQNIFITPKRSLIFDSYRKIHLHKIIQYLICLTEENVSFPFENVSLNHLSNVVHSSSSQTICFNQKSSLIFTVLQVNLPLSVFAPASPFVQSPRWSGSLIQISQSCRLGAQTAPSP